MDKSDFITILKADDLLLYGNLDTQDLKSINKRINVQNVATYFQIAKYFNFTKLSKLALCYIERCFTVFAGAPTFLELMFSSIAKILASSELNLDSELQIYYAADAWLNHNITERRKYSKYLLTKIRLSLLSNHALDYILGRTASSIISY